MEVDTCYRQFVMTVAQVVDEFGIENCSRERAQRCTRAAAAALARDRGVPRDRAERQPHRRMGPKGLAFREVYWEWGQSAGARAAVRGFHENPVIAPRWDIVGNDAYGRSPGMDALGDIKQLQVEQKRKAQAIDKMVNPPMVASIVAEERARVAAARRHHLREPAGRPPGFKPVYEVKPKIRDMMEDIGEVQQRVKDTFF
jgi:hypothetical protein